MEDRLSSGLKGLGIRATDAQLSKLRLYARMVLDYNRGYNLMKAAGEDEMYVNHILDSLAALPHVDALARRVQAAPSGRPLLADIGSGGGCPGVPLAVLMDGCQFRLVERMERRVSFLSSVVRELDLPHVSVMAFQAEKVPPESFDIALFRAFHPFDRKTTRTLMSLIRRGGFLVAYKARSEKISAEMEGIRDMVPSFQKLPLSVPFLEDHERNLVVIQKPLKTLF